MIKHRRLCRPYSLIQKGRRLKLPTDIMLKVFDSCVAPILLYGCEVWGYENTDIIEKVHTKFCKCIFGVSKLSHNMPIYGEIGRYPLSITIKQRMVCYWTRILKRISINLIRSCMTSYITFIAKIFTRQAGLNIIIQFFRIMA